LNKQSTTNQESALVDGNKKALLKSEGLIILWMDIVSFVLTYLSRHMSRGGIGTLLTGKPVAGCQGFFGPLPSAFLDKCCKELV